MNAISDEKPLYREVQQFRQIWLWILLIPSELALVIVLGYGMVKQLILGQPWGDQPMSGALLAVVGSVAILISVGVLCLLYGLKLVTEVREDGLYVRFSPFRPKRIAFRDIKHYQARTYRPIMEYGGWGIRWGLKGKAYNVCGNRGVQLELGNGKRLLIGSQRADELAQAIQSRMEQ